MRNPFRIRTRIEPVAERFLVYYRKWYSSEWRILTVVKKGWELPLYFNTEYAALNAAKDISAFLKRNKYGYIH